MSANPKLVVHDNASYDQFAMEHTESAYEKLGIAPGAFYSPGEDTVHTSRRVYDLACQGIKWALKLLAHEFGHAAKWVKSDHPTNLLPAKVDSKRDWKQPSGIGHAFSVGFDVRAYSRFLRFRKGDLVRWTAAVAWFEAQKSWVETA